ncbi:class I SAM-dependent methyltransferase [Gordonia liuliyuniae]|uniref:Class I SAM-dependent methyltransferase n=1 Tax=Gordonia liuliyuniae TaxID=2911517 RepID=A0ABS9ITW9_9ACTN|nr:class I SAM-dependent methyltransferase [Gordonia liuliyuniae]MCF8589021.1 class I SAM-dependent methyltransferase [Gordonia liuliyuniae]
MTEEHEHGPGTKGRHPETAQEWDELYSTSDRLWTTNVNPALVAEIDALEPGSALDIGSGEGADARWLTEKGWTVTAVDISQVAIDRARAADPEGSIAWHRLDVAQDSLPNAPFGLVSAIYFHIARRQEPLLDALIDAVAPGGRFLLVMHAARGMKEHGFDPSDYFLPSDIADRLGDDWEVEVNETRPRGVPAGNGAHIDDDVLRARRIR